MFHQIHKNDSAITNAATKAETIKDEINPLSNLTSSFNIDTISIKGDMESELKLMPAAALVSEANNRCGADNENIFYPRFLIVTSSCIGARLDSSSIRSLNRIGFPTHLFDVNQEMGRSSRNVINNG